MWLIVEKTVKIQINLKLKQIIIIIGKIWPG